MDRLIELNIDNIRNGLPGITQISGGHLYEACVVCLSRQKHLSNGTRIKVYNAIEQTEYTLVWENIFTDQLDRTWADQFYATEHAATCIAILLVLKTTQYTVVEKSARKNGFDYWLGNKNDVLFQKKARLEVSGIFNGSQKKVNRRYNIKIKQTNLSDELKIPAFIGIVEFFTPLVKFGEK